VLDRDASVSYWHRAAACRSHADEARLWFPEARLFASAAAAKKICAGCPVRLKCLSYALENDIASGVWGGLTAGERRRLTA
jgi:WhiB family redox-sensing transcriptional regulator